MYSTTISPRGSIRSDGQLHRRPAPAPAPGNKPAPSPPPPQSPAPRAGLLHGISAEQVLIMVIAYLLLQNEKPDWMLVLALVYVLF